jgi:CheY-like chemotaxis protein
VPVLALSARAALADIRRGREAGFAEYLTKPLQIPALVEALSRALTPTPATPATSASAADAA